jgi:hypothetical protein
MITHQIGPIASGFRLLSGIPEAWETVYNLATNDFSNNWQGYTARSWFDRGYLLANATKFRFTFSAHAEGNIEYSKVYAGEGRDSVFSVAPTQVFFGGSPSVIIPGGTSVVSDEVTLSYNGLGQIMLSMYVPPGTVNNIMASVPTNYYAGSTYYSGDYSNTLGGSPSVSRGGVYGVTKIEMYTGGNWKEINKYANTYLGNGWNNYTVRSRLNSGFFVPTRPYVRLGYMANMSKCFIGNGVSNSSLDFDGTPYQLTFGGLPNTGTDGNKIYFSDDVPTNIFNPAKSMIFSHHQSTNFINVAPIPAGCDARYAYGDAADDITFGGANYGGWWFGPVLIDEKY